MREPAGPGQDSRAAVLRGGRSSRAGICSAKEEMEGGGSSCSGT